MFKDMRIASYNLRVDHDADVGTVHVWSLRRPLVVSSIRALAADLIGVQEPSPLQAKEIEHDLGSEWGVAVTPCDPEAWIAAGESGPDGQVRDGNGFVWRRERLELLQDVETIWLSPEPSKPFPSQDGNGAWGGSKFQRTCVFGLFKDLATGKKLAVFSAHFDHMHSDDLATDKDKAPSRSAELVMSRARSELSSADVVIVMGDFNTFQDRGGACYSSLVAAAQNVFCDIRDSPGCYEIDAGRGDSSWEGWEDNAFARSKKGDQRYDQLFIGASNEGMYKATRTAVIEERFMIDFEGKRLKVYASDHLPIVADLLLQVDTPSE